MDHKRSLSVLIDLDRARCARDELAKLRAVARANKGDFLTATLSIPTDLVLDEDVDLASWLLRAVAVSNRSW